MWFDPFALTKAQPEPLATLATPATLERHGTTAAAKVAEVAKVATRCGAVSACQLDGVAIVDGDAEAANSQSEDERIGRMIDKLEADPGLTYALETHDGIDPAAVILTLAIRGKGAGELRIPKSRYDAFALLELIERHTTLRPLH